jgi:hypothetical protein
VRFLGTESKLGIEVLGSIIWLDLSRITGAVLALEVELAWLGNTPSAFHTIFVSISPFTLRHSPVMWPAAQ